jgi:hypothetical protein
VRVDRQAPQLELSGVRVPGGVADQLAVDEPADPGRARSSAVGLRTFLIMTTPAGQRIEEVASNIDRQTAALRAENRARVSSALKAADEADYASSRGSRCSATLAASPCFSTTT